MIGEIIAIGDELTTGRIVNTTSGFAASQLFMAGHEIFAMHTIGDTPKLIGEALKRAIGRVEFVIVTGGLGSTTDDLTNEAVAEALNRPTALNADILAKIRGGINHDPKLEKLAWLPQGADVLNVHSRMAGYVLIHDDTPVFFLPGVPSQMKHLFVEQVLPRLAGMIQGDDRNHVRQRIYRVFGLEENIINAKLRRLEKTADIKIGYYPVDSEVHVSLTVLKSDGDQSHELFNKLDRVIRDLLGDYIYGVNGDTPASVMGSLLMAANQQIATAESCTGGLIASKITEVAGSSAWFVGGAVTYANELKEGMLGVERDLLVRFGAVSGPVAKAMAEGIARRARAHLAVSTTGIAGPSGGTPQKPVGTVHIGIFHDGEVSEQRHQFFGDRKRIQEVTAQTALDTARRVLLRAAAGRS